MPDMLGSQDGILDHVHYGHHGHMDESINFSTTPNTSFKAKINSFVKPIRFHFQLFILNH